MVESPASQADIRKPVPMYSPVPRVSRKVRLQHMIETIQCVAEKKERFVSEQWLFDNAEGDFVILRRPWKMKFSYNPSDSFSTLPCEIQKKTGLSTKAESDAKIKRGCAAIARKILMTIEKAQKANEKSLKALEAAEARKAARRSARGKDELILGALYETGSDEHKITSKREDLPPPINELAASQADAPKVKKARRNGGKEAPGHILESSSNPPVRRECLRAVNAVTASEGDQKHSSSLHSCHHEIRNVCPSQIPEASGNELLRSPMMQLNGISTVSVPILPKSSDTISFCGTGVTTSERKSDGERAVVSVSQPEVKGPVKRITPHFGKKVVHKFGL